MSGFPFPSSQLPPAPGALLLAAYVAAGVMEPEEADEVFSMVRNVLVPRTPSAMHAMVMGALTSIREASGGV